MRTGVGYWYVRTDLINKNQNEKTRSGAKWKDKKALQVTTTKEKDRFTEDFDQNLIGNLGKERKRCRFVLNEFHRKRSNGTCTCTGL